MDNPPVLAENTPKTTINQPKLSPKVRKFALEYFRTGNGTQSAKNAGYSEKSAHVIASENIRKPKVVAYLAILQAELDEKHKAIFSTIIERTDAITRQAEEGELLFNSKGEPVMSNGRQARTPDKASALKGLDQLSKLGALYDKNAGKTKDAQVWTGVEIDFGDGKLKVVTGTGPLDSPEKN